MKRRPATRVAYREAVAFAYRRLAIAVTVIAALAVPAHAQTSSPVKKPRRHWVTVSYDWLYTLPLHFGDHPIADLVGRPVTEAQFESYDYKTRDGAILIDVLTFSRRGNGGGLTVYPFGASQGPTLALRVSVEDLPTIDIAFTGADAPPRYTLNGARSRDLGAAIFVADRSAGWGLGSHAFVGGGLGRIAGNNGPTGDRVFAEGGGGMTSGPFGVDLSVKFAWNHLNGPVDHRFFTVPITLRGTLTF